MRYRARPFGHDGRFEDKFDCDIDASAEVVEGEEIVRREVPNLRYTQVLLDGFPIDADTLEEVAE